MDKKITYIFPCRNRYDKFFRALDNIRQLSESDNWDCICAIDQDDEVLNNAFVKLKLQSYKKVSAYYGASENKTMACNRECHRISKDTDIVILMSDDMVITQQGFDNIIREAAEGFSGLIHVPDQRVNEKLCTFPIMTKNYFDIDGFFYHPEFWSVYSDNFQMDLAKKRGKYKYVDKNIIRHEHYRGGYGVPDALMERNESSLNYVHDKEIYNKLKIEYQL